jgi:hypothetical protein
MTTSWRLEGEYLENCNCAFTCPCLLGPRTATGGPAARPTEGTCDVPLVFRIDKGKFGDVVLDGLMVALAIHTPTAMGEGDWTVGLYLDERGTAEQQAALEAVFGGEAGGAMGGISALVSERLPTRVVAIEFGLEGRRRWARIPDVLDIEVEGVEGRDGTESWFDNVKHFVSPRLSAAKAIRGSYRDHGLEWDNSGRNAHYSAFTWQGP